MKKETELTDYIKINFMSLIAIIILIAQTIIELVSSICKAAMTFLVMIVILILLVFFGFGLSTILGNIIESGFSDSIFEGILGIIFLGLVALIILALLSPIFTIFTYIFAGINYVFMFTVYAIGDILHNFANFINCKCLKKITNKIQGILESHLINNKNNRIQLLVYEIYKFLYNLIVLLTSKKFVLGIVIMIVFAFIPFIVNSIDVNITLYDSMLMIFDEVLTCFKNGVGDFIDGIILIGLEIYLIVCGFIVGEIIADEFTLYEPDVERVNAINKSKKISKSIEKMRTEINKKGKSKKRNITNYLDSLKGQNNSPDDCVEKITTEEE